LGCVVVVVVVDYGLRSLMHGQIILCCSPLLSGTAKDETRHPAPLSPHLSTRTRSPSLTLPLCSPRRDLSFPRIAEILSPPPPHLGSSPSHRAHPTPLTHPRNPQSSPTGACRFRRIRAPTGETVRLNRPIGLEFGCSGCAQSGGLRI